MDRSGFMIGLLGIVMGCNGLWMFDLVGAGFLTCYGGQMVAVEFVCETQRREREKKSEMKYDK